MLNLDLDIIGDRLRRLDKFLAMLMKLRIAEGGLSDAVAESKRNHSEKGIFIKKRPDIENERIVLMRKWANEFGIDPNVAATIMTILILESCRIQDEYMVKQYQSAARRINEDDPEEVFNEQRRNLLMLTKAVAPSYDEEYGQDFFATRSYLDFEKQIMLDLISSISENKLVVDLGCATGVVSRMLRTNFDEVLGIDISPHMIREANNRLMPGMENVRYIVDDLEQGLNLESGSVSFIVMNLGTASEIKNIGQIVVDMERVLCPGGGFFLSFYNSESLRMKLGFLPWPMQLAAYVDPNKESLEVNYKRKIYSLYAKAMSSEEIKSLLVNFDIESIHSCPTLATLLPNIILSEEDKDGNNKENKNAKKMIRDIDITLASNQMYPGTYLIVTGTKPQE
jgi:ubiquinone/menaquinone biosynthesis C-methylase UbiE/chorismate mutase